MGSEHNMAGRLPEPPAPAPEAREAAIARALQQFDRLHQEPARDAGPRVLRPAGAPRGRTTLARPSVRYLVAASVAAFIAVPVGWLYLKDAQQLEGGQVAVKAKQETSAPVPPQAESATRSVGDRSEAAAPPPVAAPLAPPAMPAPPAAAPPSAASVPPAAPDLSFAPPAKPAPSVVPAQPAAPAPRAGSRVAPAPGGALRSEPRPAPAAPPAPLARQQAPAAVANSQGDLGACSAGDPDRSIAGCTRIIEDRAKGMADRRQAHLERGMAYARRGELDRAISDFTESIRLDPANAAAFYNRSLAYRAKGEHDRARADCAQASGLDSGYRSRC